MNKTFITPLLSPGDIREGKVCAYKALTSQGERTSSTQAIAVHYRSFLLTIPYLVCHEIMKRASELSSETSFSRIERKRERGECDSGK